MMQQIRSLIRLEFKQRFSNPVSLVFFLVLPIIFTGAVSAGLSSSMTDNSAPTEAQFTLFVVAPDDDPLVAAFLDTLQTLNFSVENVDTLPEEQYGLEIPAGFSEQLLAGEVTTLTLHTLPTSTDSPAVEQALRAAQGRVGGAALVAKVGLEQAREAGIVTGEAEEQRFFAELLQDTLEATETPPATADVRWPEEAQITDSDAMATSAEHASAGQIVTWVQITLLGAAEVLVDERLSGTLQRMLVAPMRRSALLLGKLLATLLVGLLQIAILLVGGGLIFGVTWGNSPLAVALVSFSFALAIGALGILLATVIRTRGQANSAVVGLAMAMSALAGAWFPLEITPPFYRRAVQVLPANWAMRAYTAMLARGAGLADVWPHILILLSFALLFTLVALWRFRSYE